MPWSMKKRRPIVAPGWISTPVAQRASWDTVRASNRRSGLRHNRWDNLWAQMACSPE